MPDPDPIPESALKNAWDALFNAPNTCKHASKDVCPACLRAEDEPCADCQRDFFARRLHAYREEGVREVMRIADPPMKMRYSRHLELAEQSALLAQAEQTIEDVLTRTASPAASRSYSKRIEAKLQDTLAALRANREKA